MMSSLVLDSSIVVKWFKKGEEFEEEALKLRKDVLSSSVKVFASEMMHLDVCRALVKVGYPSQKIEEVYATLGEMFELGFLKSVPVTVLKETAEDLIVKLNLYVAGALSLATAIVNTAALLTEDTHLLRQDVKNVMEKRRLTVIRLRELYSQPKNL